MIYTIYHSTGKERFTEAPEQPRKEVGTVEANNLNEAFQRAQNGVLFKGHWNLDKPCRSTSVGNVIADEEGNQFLVLGMGFQQIGKTFEDAEEYFADMN